MRRKLPLLVLILGFFIIVSGLSSCEDLLDAASEAATDLGITETFGADSQFGQELAAENGDNTKAKFLGTKESKNKYSAILPAAQKDSIGTALGWVTNLTGAEYSEVTQAPVENIIGKCIVEAEKIPGIEYNYTLYVYEENTVKAEATEELFKPACNLVGTWYPNTNEE